jgi:hypothetical protein
MYIICRQSRTKNSQSYVQCLFINCKCNIDITFSQDEITLLNKVLEYNLHYKHEHWFTDLAVEAETAINLLPPTDQEHVRYKVTKNIQQLYTRQKHQRHHNTHGRLKK